MNPLRIVLVGLGTRGRYWAEVINRSSDCELCAYVDPNPAALEKAKQLYGPKPSFGNL